MTPAYFAVKNFARYQHYKHRNPPWLKLYYALLDDDAFIMLSMVDRAVYMQLLLVAGTQENCVRHDPAYLQKVLRADAPVDVSALFTAGFLVEVKKPGKPEDYGIVKPEKLAEAWIDTLKQNPAYAGRDIALEAHKCRAWCEANHAAYSKRRLINWLNRPPLPGHAHAPAPAKKPRSAAEIIHAQEQGA